MAGKIIGFYGYQRQGKTAGAVYIARVLNRDFNVPLYTNIYGIPGFTYVESINDIPFDFQPKVFLCDELYFSLDSRSWKDNSSCTIFLNTIGKQNILFLYTAIYPDMVEMRIRKQTEIMFFAKKQPGYIEYGVFDCYRKKMSTLIFPVNDAVYKFLSYDTKEVPGLVDFNVDYKNYFNKRKER